MRADAHDPEVLELARVTGGLADDIDDPVIRGRLLEIADELRLWAGPAPD